MAIAAPARVAVVPVAASAALRRTLGTPREGTLLGSGEHGAWAQVGEDVLVLARADGVRMPNGIDLPPPIAARLAGLEAGAPCAAGAERLVLSDWAFHPVRWWDPRPALPSVAPGVLQNHVALARRGFAPVPDEGLGAALAASDARATAEAARRLIGRGPGLTPLGDDVLAGALASALLVGGAAGRRDLQRLVTDVAPALCAAALRRTTALAATLLRHACRGEVDDASAAFLRALCGQGTIAATRATLLALGHTSGRGLATGILLGAAAAGGEP